MPYDSASPTSHALCVSLCDIAQPNSGVCDIEQLTAQTCIAAGFPYCERLYVGSYFCEHYFLAISDEYLEAVSSFAQAHDLGVTLVTPFFGQSCIERGSERLSSALDLLGPICDEAVANDVASFAGLVNKSAAEYIAAGECEQPRATANPYARIRRIGLGRLFCKDARDARYPLVSKSTTRPELSDDMLACLTLHSRSLPNVRTLIEIDPMSSIVDVSDMMRAFKNSAEEETGTTAPIPPEIAIHLPYCYTTTGRTCGPASLDEPDSQKFRPNRSCALRCLQLDETCTTDEGARYVKHGRTFFFENPSCEIAGTNSWRIVYAASPQSQGMHTKLAASQAYETLGGKRWEVR